MCFFEVLILARWGHGCALALESENSRRLWSVRNTFGESFLENPACRKKRSAEGARSLFRFWSSLRHLFSRFCHFFRHIFCQTPFAELLLWQGEKLQFQHKGTCFVDVLKASFIRVYRALSPKTLSKPTKRQSLDQQKSARNL